MVLSLLVVDDLYNSYRTIDKDICVYVAAWDGNSWIYDKYTFLALNYKIWDSSYYFKEKSCNIRK